MTRTTSFTTACQSALSSGWTRREFLRGAAGVVALPSLTGQREGVRFAYVACGDDMVRVFRVLGERWTLMQQVRSRMPSFVLFSPVHATLYVANEVDEHEGVARGTVEAFQVDADGRLVLTNRTALSFSATRPRHLALSPDGKYLVTAAYGGGIYNVAAVEANGRLGAVTAIFKDTGCGPHALQSSAHPHSLFFDASGQHLLSSDFGSDRLNVFAFGEGGLRRRMQRATGEESGPSACVPHPSGLFVYAWHSLEQALVCYPYEGGCLGEAVQRVPISSGALGMHPSGRMLYSPEGAWMIDTRSGRLARVKARLAGGNAITVSHDGTSVYVLDGTRGTIAQISVHRTTGEVHCRTNVAVAVRPRSIAVKTS